MQEFVLGYITAVATLFLLNIYLSYREVKELRKKSDIIADMMMDREKEE